MHCQSQSIVVRKAMNQFGFFGWILVIAVYVLNAIPSSRAVQQALNGPQLGSFGLKVYYVFHKDKVQWETAGKICKTRFKGELVSIKSQKELDELKAVLIQQNVADRDYWTSGSVIHSIGGLIWSWFDGEIPLRKFSFWAKGEPNKSTFGQCLVSQRDNFRWVSRKCQEEQHFVCTKSIPNKLP